MNAHLNTIPEACERLRISRTKLYELIRVGELETVHIGARRFVSDAAISALIDRSTEAVGR